MDPLMVSVLIVNFNGARHLPACLTALEQQTLPRDRFEVILVDNASSDGSEALVRDRYPWVRLVARDRNTGFTGGNNEAARHARGTLLALLNNDTIPDPYWLEEMLRARAETGADAVASKLVFADDPRVVNSAGLFLLRDGRGADRGFRATDVGQFEETIPVFAACAAAVLVPAPPSGEPLFDSRFFLYYEDLDLGWRMRRVGKRFVYAPRSLVRHVHGAAAGEASAVFRFHVERNRALASLRNADPVLAVWSAAVLFAKAALGRGGWATIRAAASYLRLAPAILVERWGL